MDSMFRMGFQRSGFRPLPFGSRRRLGQDDSGTIYTSIDQMPDTTTTPTPGLYTSIDQMPDSTTPTPGIITSVDQGPAAQPVPGVVTSLTPSGPGAAPSTKVPDKQPAGTSDSDWAKMLAAGLKAAGEGYGAYTKADIAKMNAQAAQLKARNPSVASLLTGTGAADSSSSTAYIIMGVAAAGLIGLMIAFK